MVSLNKYKLFITIKYSSEPLSRCHLIMNLFLTCPNTIPRDIAHLFSVQFVLLRYRLAPRTKIALSRFRHFFEEVRELVFMRQHY